MSLLLSICASAVSADDSRKILEKLQEKYDNLTDLEIDFKQEVHSGVFTSVERESGKMYLAKGDKFRVQTDEQTIVSDGKLLWVYSKENKQVVIEKLSGANDLVRPSDYIFSFRESYKTTMLPDTVIDKTECRTVRFSCDGEDEFIQEMTLYVGKDDLLTHRAVYIDINANGVEIDFSKIKVDKGIPGKIFRFKTPKGVEEVRIP